MAYWFLVNLCPVTAICRPYTVFVILATYNPYNIQIVLLIDQIGRCCNVVDDQMLSFSNNSFDEDPIFFSFYAVLIS